MRLVSFSTTESLRGQLNTDNVLPVLDKVWRWISVTITEAAIVTAVEKAQEEAPQENTPPQKKAGTISAAQEKRLYAIAYNVGMNNEKVHAFLKDIYGFESAKDIPWQQYNEICTAIKVWPTILGGTMPRVANWTSECEWCASPIEVGDDIYFINRDKVCGPCADEHGYTCPYCGEVKKPIYAVCYACKMKAKQQPVPTEEK